MADGRYAAGVGSIIELSDAELAAELAGAQEVGAQYDLATARAALCLALGRQLGHERPGARIASMRSSSVERGERLFQEAGAGTNAALGERRPPEAADEQAPSPRASAA